MFRRRKGGFAMGSSSKVIRVMRQQTEFWLEITEKVADRSEFYYGGA
jgi:hypothetical protein